MSPNRLQRQFNPDAPDERWVTDITYIRTHEGWLYLAVVVDLFSRKIIGWSMQSRMKKSIDQFRFGASERRGGSSSVASPMPFAFHTQAVKMMNVVDPLVINVKTFTPQKLPDTPVSKAAAFRCQFSDARG